jgi:hypothetical protein
VGKPARVKEATTGQEELVFYLMRAVQELIDKE